MNRVWEEREEERPTTAATQGSEGLPPGADLSRLSPDVFRELRSPCPSLTNNRGFEHLQVLNVAGASIDGQDLAGLIPRCPRLRKLDASYCGLTSLPERESWASLRYLASLFLHRNNITRWEDVEKAVGPPELVWLTLFENPIASQPEYRELVVERAKQILAVDYWVVTDDERLKFIARRPTRGPRHLIDGHLVEDQLGVASLTSTCIRFVANCQASVVPFRAKPSQEQMTPAVLFREARDELEKMYSQSRYCSAAFTLQTAWRSLRARLSRRRERDRRLEKVLVIQSHFRKFIWRRRTLQYLKGYLGQIDQLDLMLDAREMLTLRATKMIEATCRRWIQRRKDRRKVREAATLLSRCIRGYLVRSAQQRKLMDLDKYRYIYFPENYAWEFLALVNVARRECRMRPLSVGHQFEPADVLGLRIPDAVDIPRRRSTIARLISLRSSCLVRPLRSGRYPGHLWDGPLHQLVDEYASTRIKRAYAKVKRRAANVDNRCRRAFLRSCVLGPHPINCRVGPLDTSPEAESQVDFRDVYCFGEKLGEGTFGMAFECTKRRSKDRTLYVARLAEHANSWWGRFPGSREAQLRMLSLELDSLKKVKHHHVARILDIYADESFVYFVMEKFESTIASVALASKRFGQRGLPGYVIGEMIAQLLRGVSYLHSRHVVHRDVRAENCVVDTAHPVGKPFRALISDLNAARYLEPGVYLKNVVGAPEYWAPEVIARLYAHGADVWSVGVITWFLLTTRLPFADPKEAASAPLSRQPLMSDDQFDLCEKLLAKGPIDRCSAHQAGAHKWVMAAQERHRQDVEGAGAVHADEDEDEDEEDDALSPAGGSNQRDSRDDNASIASDEDGVGKRHKVNESSALLKHVLKSVLFKLNPGGDRKNVEDWTEREMWLSHNGTMVYWSETEQQAMVYYTFADIRSAVVEKMEEIESARQFSFQIHIKSVAENTDNWSEFATETAELRDKWISHLCRFSAARVIRDELKKRIDQRYDLGEKISIGLASAVEREARARLRKPAEDQFALPVEYRSSIQEPPPPAPDVYTYEWWKEDRCKERGLTTEEAPLTKLDRSSGVVTHLWPATSSCFQRLLDDCANASGGARINNEAAGTLWKELQSNESRLTYDGEGLRRVFDLLVLRLVSPSGAYLTETLTDSSGKVIRRLPSRPFRAVGKGAESVEQELLRLIEQDMKAVPEAIEIHMAGAHKEIAVKIDKSTYPGIDTLATQHFFSAHVRGEASTAKLVSLGLRRTPPDEEPKKDAQKKALPKSGEPKPKKKEKEKVQKKSATWQTTLPDGTQVTWEWMDPEQCRRLGIVTHGKEERSPAMDGFQPISLGGVSKEDVLNVLQRHDIDPNFLGVGGARTMSNLVAEVNKGEARLCEKPEVQGELRRYIRKVTLRITNPLRAHLVKTTRVFGQGQDGLDKTSEFPEAVMLPFEDIVGTVRRVLLDLDVPYGTALARIYPEKAEHISDPSFPGIQTVYLRRVAEVQLESTMLRYTTEVPALRGLQGRQSPELRQQVQTEPVEIEGGGTGSELWSSAPPLDVENSTGQPISLVLQDLLEGPESDWPEAAQEPGSTLRLFLQEAKSLGSRPYGAPKPAGSFRDPATGVKVYRDAVWLGTRVLCYKCESARLAESLVSLLLHFGGTGGDAPLVKPVPFLVERFVRDVAAAVCVQAAFRGHLARKALPCSLRTAAAMRRAVLCIQQAWRWSLLRRRFQLLEGAVKCVSAVKTGTLYIEERMLMALNLVNDVDRFCPLLPERNLGFGYIAETDSIVIVDQELRAHRKLISQGRPGSKDSEGRSSTLSEARLRQPGLPRWLIGRLGDAGTMELVRADDYRLSRDIGLHGLLLQGIGEPNESHVTTVNMPSVQQAAAMDRSGSRPALAASGGQLRFVELRFRSTAQAKQRAMALFLCTYCSMHRAAVPMVPRAMLQSPTIAEAIMRLWDSYGLSWPAGDRAAVFRLRERYSRPTGECIVPINGRETWQTVAKREWMAGAVANSDARHGVSSDRLSEEAKTSRGQTPTVGSLPSMPSRTGTTGTIASLPPIHRRGSAASSTLGARASVISTSSVQASPRAMTPGSRSKKPAAGRLTPREHTPRQGSNASWTKDEPRQLPTMGGRDTTGYPPTTPRLRSGF